MKSFKIQLHICTSSNAIHDASMIDFGSQNGHKTRSNSLPNWFEGAWGKAFNEDNIPDLKNNNKDFFQWRFFGFELNILGRQMGPRWNPDGSKIDLAWVPWAFIMPLRFRDKFLIKFCSTSQRPRTPKPFKTLMTSFKIQLSLNTTLDAINDASMIDFGIQNGHKIVPKTLPNRFEGALKEALVEDNTWKVKNQYFITKKSANWRYGGGLGLPPCKDLFRINY